MNWCGLFYGKFGNSISKFATCYFDCNGFHTTPTTVIFKFTRAVLLDQKPLISARSKPVDCVSHATREVTGERVLAAI